MRNRISFFPFLCMALLFINGCGTNSKSNTVILNTAVNPEVGGVITPKSGEFKASTEVELVAEPAEGYLFEHWEGDVTGNTNPSALLLDTDKTVSAVFVKKQYDLTITVEGEGRVDETVVSAKSEHEHGTVIRLRAQSEWGWQFKEWKGSAIGTENPITIEVDEAKSITAVFELNQYAVHISIEGQGTVIKDPEKEAYDFEENITLNAEPDEGWRLLEWKGDIAGDLPKYEIESISSDLNITAVYTPVQNPLWAMGYNHNGQLGDGTTDDQFTPVRNIYEVESVTAGAFHSLFIKTDGTLWGVGFNNFGQLGNGNEQDQHRPIQIDEDVIKITAGEHHSLYIKSDGTL